MMDVASGMDASGTPEAVTGPKEGPQQHIDDDVARSVSAAHRAFTIAWIAALVAVVLAIAVNWFWSPGTTDPFPGYVGTEPLPEPSAPALESSAVDLLPPRVLSYETITRQAIPGQDDRAAEAIYVTLNMDVEIQRPINTYARVELLGSSNEAGRRAAELMESYPDSRADILVGRGTIAASGFAPDDSAYNVVWTKGSNVYMVKTSYRDIPPVRKARIFLENVGRPVFDGVADFVPEDD